jgi:WD40 repeat protein
VWSVEYCADGRQLVTASTDATAKLWSADGMVLKTLVGHDERLIRAYFDPACEHVITASTDGTARIWTTVGDSVIAQLGGHDGGAASVFFHPDGSRVFTTSADGGAVYTWDVATWERLAELRVPDIGDGLVEVSENGRYVLAMTDEMGATWDLASGRRLATLEGHTDTINWGIFSFDGTRVVTGDLRGDTIVWNTSSGESLVSIDGGGKIGAAVQFAGFRPDDDRIIVSSLIATRIHDARSGEVVVELDTGGAPVTMGRFTADGRQVLTTNSDHPAEIWNAETGQSELAIEGISEGTSAAAISADGSLIATGGHSGEVRVWDAQDGGALATIRAHTRVSGTGMTVRWIEFSRDSQTLATAGSDGYVRVWNVGHEVTRGAIETFMACRVPWRLTEQKLASSPLDPDECELNPDFN